MLGKRARQPGLADGTELSTKDSKTKVSSEPKTGASRASKSTARSAPKTKQAPRVAQNRIIVGVDYGTTNSGVAHVMSQNCDAQDVEVIKNWPDGISGTDHLEKVPSRIAFKFENKDLDEDKWGYDIPAGAQSYSWTKLLLDSGAQRSAFDSEELSGKLRSGLLELPKEMTAEQVATMFLSNIYQHTMEVLERRYTAELLRVTPIEFWFTVPATWQESATDATRTAAKEAGFSSRVGDSLSIITEPEAAAIAVVSQAAEKYPSLIKVQLIVLMCDFGGGTLDFQALTVTKIRPHLQTEETIPGIGAKSGSTYIDCSFHAWLESTFGEAFTRLPTTKTGTGSRFMSDWEVVKKSFTGKDLKKKSQIPLPALGVALQERNRTSISYDTDDHCVLVTGAEIANMFEPVIQNALGLIRQLHETLAEKGLGKPGLIIPAGGLGSSEYVWRYLQQYAKEDLGGSCEIFVDSRAWSAVVRGAAICGLKGSLVLSKRAKRSYGIGVHQAFREGVDDEADAVICPVKGKRANGYVYYPIKVGAQFTPNMKIRTNLYASIPGTADDEDLIFKWNLFSCALETAPDKEDHDGLKREGTIVLDLSNTHKRTKKNDGNHDKHEAVKIAIVFKMGSEHGTLVVEALHGQKVVGTAKIDYAKTHARQILSRSAGLLDG